jgi:glutaredoxin
LLLGRHGCPYCARATQLLQDHGIAFEAIYLGDGLSMQGVKAAAGAATVPQVFIDGKLIGGAQPLQAFLAQRKS